MVFFESAKVVLTCFFDLRGQNLNSVGPPHTGAGFYRRKITKNNPGQEHNFVVIVHMCSK